MKHSYTLKRGKRRTVAIVITKDAVLEVRAPLKMSLKKIDAFVESKAGWIETNLKKQRELLKNDKRQTYLIGSTVRLFGNDVKIIRCNVTTAVFDGSAVVLPEDTQESEIRQQLQSIFKKIAAEYITARVRVLAVLSGSTPSSVRITSAKTRWGSCTADRLCFSYLLVAADKDAIDYVIFHELSHIKHHNHSAQFWAEVARLCPQHGECRQRLRELAQII